MVSFSCDLCADVVKKPKTLQHLYRCPEAQFTCIDCSTTFHGDSYLYHTSCISEAEKYQKGLYKGNKKGKQDTSNKQRQNKVGTPNNINEQSEEQGNDNNALKNSEQHQIPNVITDNNKNELNLKRKKKKKKKKNQQQDNQLNGIKIVIKGKKVVEKDIAAKATNDNNEAQEILDSTIKKNDNTFVNSNAAKKKKKSKRTTNNINENGDSKVEESKDSNNIADSNESQSVQTYAVNNVENLSNSSSKKKKQKKKNDTINKNSNNNLENPNSINENYQSLVGILKKEFPDGKSKKRKSVEFMLPEFSTNNKKTNENIRSAKKSKSSHKNDVTHNLSNYYESVPAAVKKIFKSNNHEELNLKRLEEMVVRQLISNSNSSESDLKEKFLENIVLTMKDGKIILK